jgi:cytochrome c-type biogenesis protein CcmH
VTSRRRAILRSVGVGLLTLAPAVASAQAPSSAETPPALDPRQVVGAPRGRPLTGPERDAATEETAALLRCPICQGLSVADSPTAMAQNMRGQVREMLGEGYDREQILAFFERSYGEFVRLEPPLRGVNWLVWLGPAAGLAAGAVAVGWALRRSRAAAAPPAAEPDVPGSLTLPDDPRLAAYVLKVRELVHGWPGGVPPEPRA